MTKPAIDRVTTVYNGWLKILKLSVRTASGAKVDREVEHHGAAVAVLPYDPARRVAIVVRQLRPAVLHVGGPEQIIETVAGMLDEDDPEEGARREAHEEVGLRLGALESLGHVWSSPGVSTERIHLYLATYAEADRVSAGGGLASEHEEIDVVEMPLADLAALADSGGLLDLKTFALVQALRLRRQDLFL